jgi:hypothetical protein
MTTRTTTTADVEVADADAVHPLRLGSLFGVPAVYAIVVLIGLAAGTSMTDALFIAAWPAIVGGPFFGALAVLGAEIRDHERHAVVVPITQAIRRPATTASAA